jgi:ATP-dependent exoDNAse (exonuclease V) beta subunit
LLYNNFYGPNGEQLGLIAGRRAEDDALVSFLRGVEQAREADERCRLVYVAATRARRKLHLIADLHVEGASPRAGSLLATLWPGVEDAYADSAGRQRSAVPQARAADDASAAAGATPELVELPLRRLELGADVPFPDLVTEAVRASGSLRPEFEWVHPASVQVGTLIHRELQRWADRAAAARQLMAPAPGSARYRRELALLGVESRDLEEAAERVAEALRKVWADPTGRWIVEPRPEAASELRLTLRNGDELEHLELDRTFVDDGVRWIVDYKTGRHLGADIEEFLDSEVERYRNQLERYAWAMHATDRRPIRVGLYFPLLGRFRDWTPEAAS